MSQNAITRQGLWIGKGNVLTLMKNSIKKGMYVQGKANGEGVRLYFNGAEERGIFENDELVKGVKIDENGSSQQQ